MANAKFCDRCGNFFIKEHYKEGDNHYAVTNVLFTLSPQNPGKIHRVGKSIDLCPDCQKKLAEFMNSGKEK